MSPRNVRHVQCTCTLYTSGYVMFTLMMCTVYIIYCTLYCVHCTHVCVYIDNIDLGDIITRRILPTHSLWCCALLIIIGMIIYLY